MFEELLLSIPILSFLIVAAIIFYSLYKSNFFKDHKENIYSEKPFFEILKLNLKISLKYLLPIVKFYFSYIIRVFIYFLFFWWIYSTSGNFEVLALFIFSMLLVRFGFLQKGINELKPKDVIVLSQEEHERIKKGIDSIEKYKKQA